MVKKKKKKVITSCRTRIAEQSYVARFEVAAREVNSNGK